MSRKRHGHQRRQGVTQRACLSYFAHFRCRCRFLRMSQCSFLLTRGECCVCATCAISARWVSVFRFVFGLVDSLHFGAVWILSTRRLSVVRFVLRWSGCHCFWRCGVTVACADADSFLPVRCCVALQMWYLQCGPQLAIESCLF